MDVLVIDVGGSHVKVAIAGRQERWQTESSPGLGPAELVAQIVRETSAWHYDVVSIGYPGTVGPEGPTTEPGNLGGGWVGFDFERAIGHPVRIVNDAVLQALGAYRGGRMLFLGFGTGIGSALITERVAVPLELGELPYENGAALFEFLGRAGLERLGPSRWQDVVRSVAPRLKKAFVADYIVLGGGNAALITSTTSPDVICGGNDDAIEGGSRLWREIVEPHDREPSRFWRVVQ